MEKTITVIIVIILMLFHGSGIGEILAAEDGQEDAVQDRKAVYLYDEASGHRNREKTVSRVIRLKYATADKALNVITRISPNMIAVAEGTDAVVVRGESNVIEEAATIIHDIDIETAQLIIECSVVEMSENALNSLGINWGKEQGTFKFSVDEDTGLPTISDDFQVTVNALVAKGDANVLANPKITTLDGKQAEINIGNRIPYAVPADTSGTSAQWAIRYIDAGVSLKIMSDVRADGIIISNIKPEVSSVSEWRSTAAGEFPVISTRNADVTVKIKDGETLAIGGLISKSERENTAKLPFFSEIPLIGWLFQRKINEEARTEIVFLITPRIIK